MKGLFFSNKLIEIFFTFKGSDVQWDNTASMHQTHSSKILHVERSGVYEADGLYTGSRVPLLIKVADCVPVFFWNNETIGVVHAGWRGVFLGIIGNLIKTIGKGYYILGPSICGECYEVGEELYNKFIGKFPFLKGYFKYKRDNKFLMDLRGSVRFLLDRAGFIEESFPEFCTFHSDLFYSYRKGDEHKRNIGIIKRR